jgi:PPOX class probable F420-dependent enzyme
MNGGAAAIDVPGSAAHAGLVKHSNATATTSSDLLADERYLALTTFTRDGTPKSVPVWPVDAGDGRIGFITSQQTWKVKRINNDHRVVVQPCDAKGRVRAGTQVISASAKVAVGAPFEALQSKVQAKYGYQLRFINFLHALPGKKTGHRNDCAVVISLDLR